MDNDKVYEELLKSSINFPWVQAPRYSLRELCACAKEENYRKDDVIYDTETGSDFVYIVKSGRIGHYIVTSDGHRKIVAVFTEGTLFGELQSFDRQPDFSIAQVTSKKASVYKVYKKDFLDKISQNRDLMMAVLENLSYKMRLLSSQVEYAVYKSSATKVAFFLLSTCKHYGVKTEQGYKLNMKFTHSEIAATIGLSRVSVTNNFISLIENGIIEKTKDFYYLKDLEYLMKLLN